MNQSTGSSPTSLFQTGRRSVKRRLTDAVILALLLTGGILASGPLNDLAAKRDAAATSTAAALTRLTLAEASQRLLGWYQQQKPDLNPQVTVPVKELTTGEIWDRLEVQVFQVSGDIFMYDTFLVKRGQITPLGIGFGGMGVTSLAVTDLDQDGNPDLLYTYSFGSGLHRSRLGVYAPTLPGNGILEASVSLISGDLTLAKVNDYQVEVRAELDGPSSIRIGVAALQGQPGTQTLILELDKNLPQNILDRLVTTAG